MQLIKIVEELVRVLKKQDAQEEVVNRAISRYYEKIKCLDDKKEVGKSMKYLSELFNIDNLYKGSLASLICGSLIENDYPAKYITEDYINFFSVGIKKSLPILEVFEEHLEAKKEDEDEYEIINHITEKYHEEFKESIKALETLDAYYPCGVSIFSSDKEEHEKGKKYLSQVSNYRIYSNAFFGLAKLFEVLFDEKILVIDLNTQKGFVGKMSGIVDNFQLQILLMGLPELNGQEVVSQEVLEIVQGHGTQNLDKSIEGKWNMCNWEYLKHQAEGSNAYENSKYWIWSEGKPADISKFKDFRVILLDKATYQRGLPVQRTFKNLEAKIQVEKELGIMQIEAFLEEMRK